MMAFSMSKAFAMSNVQVKNLSNEQLHDIVTRAAGSLNRRMQNIMYTPSASKYAVRKAQASGAGGRFTTEGMKVYNRETGRTEYNRAALEREFARERAFFREESSTVRGAKARTKQIEEDWFGHIFKKHKKQHYPTVLVDYLRHLEDEAYNRVEDLKGMDSEYYLETLNKIGEARGNVDNMSQAITLLQSIIDEADKEIDMLRSAPIPTYEEGEERDNDYIFYKHRNK